jgi:tRNA dimethylallyltransferase
MGGHSGLIVLSGPTGSGKSELAVRIAEATGGEVVNYDAVQVYRGFDVGSAKPSPETRARVPHHLFDIADADQELNAADFARMARKVCDDIVARGRLPILVGGTFFWLRALLHGLPEMPGRDEAIRARLRRIAAAPRGPERLHRWLSKIDPLSGRRIAAGDRHRVERALEVWLLSGQPISAWEAPRGAGSQPAEEGRRGGRPQHSADDIPSVKIALAVDRPRLVERLDSRVAAMYASGLIDETRALLARFSRASRPFGAIGYREAVAVIAGEMTEAAAIAETRRRTRAYAKRQMTWLRGERDMQWIAPGTPEETFSAAMRLIEVHG